MLRIMQDLLVGRDIASPVFFPAKIRVNIETRVAAGGDFEPYLMAWREIDGGVA